MNSIGNPYSGQHYTGSIVVRYEAAESGTGADVTIETDRLNMVPITDDQEVVEFYTQHLHGNAQTMEKLVDGKARTPEQVMERVQGLADRWKGGELCSAFVISNKFTNERLGHAIFGRGDNPGESEFSVMIRPRHEDGTSAWNVGYGKETLYAMYQGLMPKYVDVGVQVRNDTPNEVGVKEYHPISFLLATSRVDNFDHRTLTRLHEGDATNKEKSYPSERWGSPRTHFYTTPEAMKQMRSRLLEEKKSW